MDEKRVCKIRQFTVEELYVTVLKAEFVKNEEEGWFKMEQLSREVRPSGSLILDAVVAELKDSYVRDNRELADRIGVDSVKLGHAVSLLTGLALNEFITRYRILEAKEYLSKTSLPLPEIAKRCGYDSVYKEMGVNPLAGCLPLLVQMPFLIAIFYALQGYPYNPEFEHFLWLPSLGEADPYYILPVLSALSTWLMSRQTGMGASGAAAQQQKIMQIFMPLFIGYISLNFPSGLVIYWIVSNVFQLVQQHFIYKGLEANK